MVNYALPIPSVGPNTCDSTSLATLSACGNLTGVNSYFIDAAFNRCGVRATDTTTAAAYTGDWQTADDGLPNLFSTDDSLVMVKRSGGSHYFLHFDTTNVRILGTSAVVGASASATFSAYLANTFYQLAGSNHVTLQKIVITQNANPALDTSVTTTVKDLASTGCLGGAYTSTWQGLLLSPAGSDDVFTVGSSSAGGQGTGTDVVSYKVSTGHCSTLNTSTGAVAIDGTPVGTITNTDRFTLHEVYQTPNPAYAILVPGQSNMLVGTYVPGVYIWQIGTTSLVHCGNNTYYCDGHDTFGYLGLIRGKPMVYHSYADPSIPQTVNLPSPPAYPDSHQSWNNNHSTDDSAPIFDKAQKVAPAIDILGTLPVPFYDELWLNTVNGNNFSRQAHTFSTGLSQMFDAQNAMATVSQTGKFAAVTSDWMASLGSDSGASSCTLGTDCRNDVFIYAIEATALPNILNLVGFFSGSAQ